MLDIHQDIEEYADYVVTKLLDEKDLDILTYPPNSGFTEEEISELKKLENNEHLKSGLRKLIADNSAGIVFNMFNFFDGTGTLKNDDGNWTGIKLVDEEPNKNSETFNDVLHDNFYESYWEWKKIRGDKKWKLDTYEG